LTLLNTQGIIDIVMQTDTFNSGQQKVPVGRFAPSPTGPLHFGSLLAAVGSYCLARQAGGRWLVRIEDLDTPRVVPGSADAILRDLEAFGFEWDGPIVYQSERFTAYESTLERLKEAGLVYDCGCSRKEILASAPHHGEEGPRYPGTCRAGLPPGRQPRALRLRVPDQRFNFHDAVFGPTEQRLADAVGDFVLKRADGMFAYQLAVVVDDHAAGVTQVVRGADLLSSTVRQIYLHSCLGQPPPNYVHLPIVLGQDGEKLSKRHGLAGLQGEIGTSAPLLRVLRFLDQDLPDQGEEMRAHELLAWAAENFDSSRISRLSSPIDRVCIN
jgi:glutamyl-Q tRNA(Asp) synthetase